jgi:hypothetical protein
MNEVSADLGLVTYTPVGSRRFQAVAVGLGIVLLLGLVVFGRRRLR